MRNFETNDTNDQLQSTSPEGADTLVNKKNKEREISRLIPENGASHERFARGSFEELHHHNTEAGSLAPEDGEHLQENLKKKTDDMDKQIGLELKEKNNRTSERMNPIIKGIETAIGERPIGLIPGSEYSGDNVTDQGNTGEAATPLQQQFTISGNTETPQEIYQEAA